MEAASTPESAAVATDKVRANKEFWKVAGAETMKTKATEPARSVKS